jgi:signal transduction histidine kinase
VRQNPDVATALIIVPVALIAVAVSVVVNGLVIQLALSPLRALQEAAQRAQAGDLAVRAPESPVSDSSIEQLVRTFNQMLESVASYRERLREIAIRALDAAENERLRLSHELHDDLAQSLTAVLVQLRIARGIPGTPQAEQLAAVAEQLGALIEQVRTLANELMPPALDMLGLGAALSSHARSVSETTGVSVTPRVDPIDGALTREAEIAMYRLVQEALHNVVRHADAQEAWLEVKRLDGRVEATVSDRGRGFAVAPVLAGGALGLLGMFERAAYVGGKVEVDSAPGRGTTVRIQIPVKENNV